MNECDENIDVEMEQLFYQIAGTERIYACYNCYGTMTEKYRQVVAFQKRRGFLVRTGNEQGYLPARQLSGFLGFVIGDPNEQRP